MSLSQREQQLEELRTGNFDLLVVGAGINGAAAAWDASLRGLRVALIDQGDFGAQTTSGCFKIIHGGLRYLQHLDFRRLIESVEEQRLLRIIAPHLLSPLSFLIPCYKPIMKRRFVIRLALNVYEFISCWRNWRVQNSLCLPRHKILSKEQCLEIAPGLNRNGLEGGVLYSDVQMNNCERLSFEVVRSAQAAGCTVLNYLSLEELELKEESSGAKRIVSAGLLDQLTGEKISVEASGYVNATGPWIDSLAQKLGLGAGAKQVFSKGIQLVVPEISSKCAFAIESSAGDGAAKISRGSRAYFIQPWQGYSLIGTSDELVEQDPKDYKISDADVQRFITELNSAYDFEELDEASVVSVFGGLRPVADDIDIQKQDSEAAKVARKDLIIDHQRVKFGNSFVSNLVTMRGVKYTTFRLFARRAIDLISKRISKYTDSLSSSSKLVSTPDIDVEKYLVDLMERFPKLDKQYLDYLVGNYGIVASEIAEMVADDLDSKLVPNQLATKAELLYCLKNEHVCRLDDLLIRRLGLCAKEIPDLDQLKVCAKIVAEELAWDAKQEESNWQLFQLALERLRPKSLAAPRRIRKIA